MKRYPGKCWICFPESRQESKLTCFHMYNRCPKTIGFANPDLLQTNKVVYPVHRAVYIASPLLLTFRQNNWAHSHA